MATVNDNWLNPDTGAKVQLSPSEEWKLTWPVEAALFGSVRLCKAKRAGELRRVRV